MKDDIQNSKYRIIKHKGNEYGMDPVSIKKKHSEINDDRDYRKNENERAAMPAYIINRSHCISAHLKQYTVINRKYMPRSAQYDTENINYDTYHVDGSQLTHTRTQHYEKQCGMHHAHYHDSKEDTVVNKKVYYIIYALLYIQKLPPFLSGLSFPDQHNSESSSHSFMYASDCSSIRPISSWSFPSFS